MLLGIEVDILLLDVEGQQTDVSFERVDLPPSVPFQRAQQPLLLSFVDMPKEIIRKRGKRKAKTTEATVEEATAESYQAQVQGASSSTNEQAHQHAEEGGATAGAEADWVTPGDGGYGSIRERVEGDAPWGFVDAEVSPSRRGEGLKFGPSSTRALPLALLA